MRNSEFSRLVGMRLPCAEGEISGLNSDYKSYDNGEIKVGRLWLGKSRQWQLAVGCLGELGE
ncbi:hypothetical protein [Algoriphagus faecimaris]|uniref:hypothetical protein n=1 Tax=Algoriphagus faecimaris TaxID=686796 RepID=UPI001121D79A|nr:hypothetical protein [Algoriphagus faecimaris]